MENREIFEFDIASTPNEAMLSTMQNGPRGPWTLACDMCIVLLVCFNVSTRAERNTGSGSLFMLRSISRNRHKVASERSVSVKPTVYQRRGARQEK